MSPWPEEKILMEQALAIRGSQARLSWVVERARQLPSFPEGERTEASRVEGCASKLWLHGVISNGRCFFVCDSDSLVVKGIGALVCECCSGRLPAEIIQRRHEPPLLKTSLGMALTQNRRSGLQKLWSRIVAFAEAHGGEPTANPSFP